jgi:hypothetical protein
MKKNLMFLFTVTGIIIALMSVSMFTQSCGSPNSTPDPGLVKMAEEINPMCPMMIDAETRLDTTAVFSNKTFMYDYTFINYENGMVDTTRVKNLIMPNAIHAIKTNPGLKYFRDNKVTIKYNYKDKNGSYMFSFVITPNQYIQ